MFSQNALATSIVAESSEDFEFKIALYIICTLILITLVSIISLFVYIVYLRVKHPARFYVFWNFLFSNIKKAAISCMPEWWLKFNKSYLIIFIRIVGSLCLYFVRAILPVNPDIASSFSKHIFIVYFVLFMAMLFMIYLFVYAIIYLPKYLYKI